MKNFIVKTAVKTFLIILAIVVVAFGVFNFACPQHMATFAEQVGNYDMAVKYASLRYFYTGSTYDLSRCFEDAILAQDNSYIVEYGNEFFTKDDCAQVMYDKSVETGINYLDLFGGSLVKARYSTGDFTGALALASDLNGTTSFAYGNPLMSLAAAVAGGQDKANAPAVIAALEGITTDDSTEQANLTELIKRLNGLVLSD